MKDKTFPIKIGLEIHGYLDTKEKLFCMCKINGIDKEGNNKPNSRICPICTGTPGSKPMAPNIEAVKKMIQIALVFGSKINYSDIVWQRKHYNWSDLPKGYQTTISGAHAMPNAVGGKFKGINLTELHLEEDPAQWNPDSGKINYNRSGLPLIEIVTEPEFSDSEQVIEWLKSLVLSLSYIMAIRRNAGIKVDVNISTYGERVEMKNLNSLEKIRKAISYEIQRQIEAHDKGEVQKMETLAYDEKLGKTIKMRSKEGAADYRFIPDPDLLMIKIDKQMVNKIKSELPEMPEVKLARLLKKHKVGEKDAQILTRNLELVEFFEKLVEFGIDAKRYMSWVTIELLRVLNYNKKTLEDEDVEILPEHLAELIKTVESGKITVLKAKQIMNDFVPKSFSLAKHKGEIGNIDNAAIENLCKQVISENAHVVDEYKSGKDASLNYL
ncbi:MAG: Asp-tRNA(Asn)/Glu-tRNA(Gln) amidotransferase subunit GatB, partial [archaeon]